MEADKGCDHSTHYILPMLCKQ